MPSIKSKIFKTIGFSLFCSLISYTAVAGPPGSAGQPAPPPSFQQSNSNQNNNTDTNETSTTKSQNASSSPSLSDFILLRKPCLQHQSLDVRHHQLYCILIVLQRSLVRVLEIFVLFFSFIVSPFTSYSQTMTAMNNFFIVKTKQ